MVVTATIGNAKMTPLRLYPAKGRATGGVRAQRFLKGETHLVLAWVGARPAASSTKGEPRDLPAPDQRRDGSGAQLRAPEIVGHLVERG